MPVVDWTQDKPVQQELIPFEQIEPVAEQALGEAEGEGLALTK